METTEEIKLDVLEQILMDLLHKNKWKILVLKVRFQPSTQSMVCYASFKCRLLLTDMEFCIIFSRAKISVLAASIKIMGFLLIYSLILKYNCNNQKN